MSVIAVMVGLVTIVAAFYGVFSYVWSRFDAHQAYQRILWLELAGSLLLGLFFSLTLPNLEWVLRVLVCLVVALPIFAVVALLTVFLWLEDGTSRVPRAEMTADLRQRVDALQQELDELEVSLQRLRANKREWEHAHDEDLFRSRQLENHLQAWQSEAGLTRIRGLKLEDWTRKNALREMDDLHKHQEILKERLADASSSDSQDSFRTQLTVLEREILRRKMDEPDRQLRELRENIDQLESRRRAAQEELRQLTRAQTQAGTPLDSSRNTNF